MWTAVTAYFSSKGLLLFAFALCVLLDLPSQPTRDIHPMLFQCWSTVGVNASCFLGCCTQPWWWRRRVVPPGSIDCIMNEGDDLDSRVARGSLLGVLLLNLCSSHLSFPELPLSSPSALPHLAVAQPSSYKDGKLMALLMRPVTTLLHARFPVLGLRHLWPSERHGRLLPSIYNYRVHCGINVSNLILAHTRYTAHAPTVNGYWLCTVAFLSILSFRNLDFEIAEQRVVHLYSK